MPRRAPEILSEAARDNRVSIVIGLNEKIDSVAVSGTLYDSLLIFEETGKPAKHHRKKFVPTYTERLVHGQGDRSGT